MRRILGTGLPLLLIVFGSLPAANAVADLSEPDAVEGEPVSATVESSEPSPGQAQDSTQPKTAAETPPRAPKTPSSSEENAWSPAMLGNRFLQTNTPLVNEKGLFEAVITHRFITSVIQAGGSNALGLDNGSAVGLGVDYVPVKNVAIQMYRLSVNADYEMAAKATLLRPSRDLPIAVGVRGGVDWNTARYAERQSGGFGQLLLSGTLGDRVTIAAAPSYTQRTPSGLKGVWNVPLILQARITKSIAAIGEYIPRKRILPDSTGQWSFGVEKSVFRHRFALWIGNSGASTVDQMLGGDFLGGVTDSNIRIGFNLIRQFEIAVD